MINQTPIIIKHDSMHREFPHLTGRTRAIILFACEYCVRVWGVIPIWTSFWRKPKQNEKPSVHHFGRGADMSRRCVGVDGICKTFLKPQIQILLEEINRVFPYGKKGIRSAIYHKVEGGVFHFHFQSRI